MLHVVSCCGVCRANGTLSWREGLCWPLFLSVSFFRRSVTVKFKEKNVLFFKMQVCFRLLMFPMSWKNGNQICDYWLFVFRACYVWLFFRGFLIIPPKKVAHKIDPRFFGWKIGKMQSIYVFITSRILWYMTIHSCLSFCLVSHLQHLRMLLPKCCENAHKKGNCFSSATSFALPELLCVYIYT